MSQQDSVSALLFACTVCGHRAILYKYPSDNAGIWECTNSECGASDACEHEDRRIETTQVDFWPTSDIDHSYERSVYVCNACEVTLDLDLADPQLDMAESEL
jgi:hypothetical protein